MSDRAIILHYHLFKNAGTSFDGILRRNFGDRWLTAEFPSGNNSADVTNWVRANPEAVAFSSHTATGPVPVIPGVRVISVLFMRDPVARIRSAYLFERQQTLARDNDRMGVHLATKTDFEGYVRGRLEVPGDRQCRNFHCARLAGFVRKMIPELDRATEALSVLDFIGEVEHFGRSMRRFAELVRPVWPYFDPATLHLNRADSEELVEVGPDLARLLSENNALDTALISRARETIWNT